mgnify:CR=1 FL=1
MISSHWVNAQKTNLIVNAATTITKIQPTMYGVFFEDINFAADGGLYAEMIKNRSFEFLSKTGQRMDWGPPGFTFSTFYCFPNLT